MLFCVCNCVYFSCQFSLFIICYEDFPKTHNSFIINCVGVLFESFFSHQINIRASAITTLSMRQTHNFLLLLTQICMLCLNFFFFFLVTTREKEFELLISLLETLRSINQLSYKDFGSSFDFEFKTCHFTVKCLKLLNININSVF